MESFALIIFGITSNLAQIKIIPALYDLEKRNLLPENLSIIGIARSNHTREEYLEFWNKTLHQENRHHTHSIEEHIFDRLAAKIHYLQGDITNDSLYSELKMMLATFSKENQKENKMFYLATFPELYTQVFDLLHKHGFCDQTHGWARVMIEKPIGNDLDSSKEMNKVIGEHFTEDQIYRLDHYLGKETLLNIMYFRFANYIFEPLMNSEHIDHIQITAAEDFGIGSRGRYYDTVGALKDVGQNHLLQMLVFASMDCPKEFTNEEITKERIKLLQHLQPNSESIVFGQYEGYKTEEYVTLESTTDTYFAFKAHLNTEKFNNLPIYFRGGKKLKETVTEISVVFKQPENALFKHLEHGNMPSVLIYRIQPNEGIVLKVTTKHPGHDVKLEETFMQYCYKQHTTELPDPYERLIYWAFMGDQTYFVDAPEVEAQWAITDPLSEKRTTPETYEQGTWGPKAADEMIQKDGRSWLTPSLMFCNL